MGCCFFLLFLTLFFVAWLFLEAHLMPIKKKAFHEMLGRNIQNTSWTVLLRDQKKEWNWRPFQKSTKKPCITSWCVLSLEISHMTFSHVLQRFSSLGRSSKFPPFFFVTGRLCQKTLFRPDDVKSSDKSSNKPNVERLSGCFPFWNSAVQTFRE